MEAIRRFNSRGRAVLTILCGLALVVGVLGSAPTNAQEPPVFISVGYFYHFGNDAAQPNVHAGGWNLGEAVQLTVSDGTGIVFETSAVMEPGPPDGPPFPTQATFDMGSFWVQRGQTLSVAGQESGFVTSIVASNIRIDEVDYDNDVVRVSGASGGLQAQGPYGGLLCDQAETPDPDGTWEAHFAGCYDITPSSSFGIFDGYTGGWTSVQTIRQLPDLPYIEGAVDSEFIVARWFAPDTDIRFEIFESEGGQLLWVNTFRSDGEGIVWIDTIGQGVDLGRGMMLTADDGTTRKELVLDWDLAVTDVDLDTSQAWGTAAAGLDQVWVGVGNNGAGECGFGVTVDNGTWSVAFGGDLCVVDLPSVDYVAVSFADDDGDVSLAHWNRPPSPAIQVVPVGDYVDLINFAAGPVTVAVNGMALDPAPDGGNGDVRVHLADYGIDLVAGDVVIASQGGSIAEVTTVHVEITAADPTTGIVSGLAPDGALVNVAAWTDNGSAERVTTAIGGTFSVNFSVAGGPDDPDPSVVTLTPGSGLAAWVYDVPHTGDASKHDWQLPYPSVFGGFFHPIDTYAVNLANAGRTVPVKWQLADGFGVPIGDPASFVALRSRWVACDGTTTGESDEIEEYAAGGSGLIYLGVGSWQFNWKTPTWYADTCRAMWVQFDDGSKSPEVVFDFR